MAPTLEYAFKMRITVSKDAQNLGSTKGGSHRVIISVVGGSISGPALELEILPGGADWSLIDPVAGISHLDARWQARNSKGDTVYAHYPGIIRIDPEIQKCLAGGPDAHTTESKDHYFFTTPVFETSSPDLKWLEQTVFLAHGHMYVPGDRTQAIEYEVYKAVSA